ncbi:YfhO family protein [Bifidobacterium sp. ESL0704]|uniref:YfhO family protein n=1 Tax=Bifidobacterium sp. ESL0704 TaxID=2983219 RepID=UPI0023F6E96A|nr:YfhO family protein [Bifidobacterium sp. ESL0704]WEV53003.1 YfhO family protein [Bifidobacterium sp. ESL0704]
MSNSKPSARHPETYSKRPASPFGRIVYKAAHSAAIVYPATVMLVAAILVVVFSILSVAPFGGGQKTLAVNDANMQYLSFFAYLKDVLSGNNSIGYTFSKGLGGNNVAVFSYYLMSPFNLLVVFFSKVHLNDFYDILVLLKLCTAGLTMSVYLTHRLGPRLNRLYTVLLSVSYALMQYNLEQSRNVMWLDGVYMLPLMALGVYYCIHRHRSLLLILSTAFAVVFNWYTAVLDGLFIVMWYVVESVALSDERHAKVLPVIWHNLGRFVLSGVAGLGLSAFVLLPTALQLGRGRGRINLGDRQWPFLGAGTFELQGFVHGSHSVSGAASLFIGALALFGFIGFLFTDQINRRTKIAVAGVLFIIILAFHEGSLFYVFSLLKQVVSYLYRFAYLAMFVMIAAAGAFYGSWRDVRSRRSVYTYVAFAVFLVLLVLLEVVNPVRGVLMALLTVSAGVVVVFLVVESRKIPAGSVRAGISVVLVAAVLADLGCDVCLFYRSSSGTGDYTANTSLYKNYAAEQVNQIKAVTDADHGTYRISQTSARRQGYIDKHLNWMFDEGFAYDYKPIVGYTSDPNPDEQRLLENLGYAQNDINISVVDTSILSADSLLASKYVLSRYPIEGLEKTKLPGASGKSVYRNPYALPFAFVASKDALHVLPREKPDELARIARITDGSYVLDTNPFVYQNQLFSQLTGSKVRLFEPLPFKASSHDGSTQYHLSGVGKGPVYGEIQTLDSGAVLTLKDAWIPYAKYGAPGVVYIPQNHDGSADVSYRTKHPSSPRSLNPLFYQLNLDELKRSTDILKRDRPDISHFSNGDVTMKVDAEHVEQLVISIISDSSWQVSVDGKPAKTQKVAGALISLPLKAGKHTVRMHYVVSGMKIGVAVSLVSLFAVFGYACLACRKSKRSEKRVSAISL